MGAAAVGTGEKSAGKLETAPKVISEIDLKMMGKLFFHFYLLIK
jgi:hypothetical protein